MSAFPYQLFINFSTFAPLEQLSTFCAKGEAPWDYVHFSSSLLQEASVKSNLNLRGLARQDFPRGALSQSERSGNQCSGWRQGGRTWLPFSKGKNSHKSFRQARSCYFRDKCVVLRVIANLHIQFSIICNMYHVIGHFLPKKHCCWPKRALYSPKSPKKCIKRDKS